MMSHRMLGLFVGGAMMCPLSLSALTYTKADSLKVVQLLDAGKKQTRGTDLTLFFCGAIHRGALRGFHSRSKSG